MSYLGAFHFIFCSQVTIYVRCLGKCCNAVLLWSSRNVLWTTKPWIDFPSARGWRDNDWLVILSFKAERQVAHTVDSTLAPEEKEDTYNNFESTWLSLDFSVAIINKVRSHKTTSEIWREHVTQYGYSVCMAFCLAFCLHPEVKCRTCNFARKTKGIIFFVHATVTVTQVTPTGAGTFIKTRESAGTIQDDNFICLDVCFPENVSVNRHVSHLLETMY